jgi:hypothetical protein
MTTDPALDDLYLPLAFSLHSNPGAYAVLAGAGVSRGAGLPTAWDIVVDLVEQMAGPDAQAGDITADSAAAWYEAKFARTLTYSDVVERLALTPTERQGLLKKYFEPSGDDDADPPGPSRAHSAIARLMQAGTIRVVVTMNFDRLFEQALREIQIEPTIVATDADARGLAPLHTLQHCIIHLHGDYLNAVSMLNTADELIGYGPHMTALLERVLTDYGLLVAGWSAEHDQALREAVSALYPSTFTMGWISPDRLNDVAGALAQSKKAQVLQTTADEAFGHLADQVEAMRERRSRHPMSLSVAVSRIKRDLSRQSPAIAAHDMLAAEFASLHSLAPFHLERYTGSDLGEYHGYIDQVVEGTRIAAGSIAVLAYWGDDGNQSWWMPELQRLSRIGVLSGSIRLIELPLVAASMLFYSAGIAFVASQGYEALARLLQLRGNRVGREPEPLAQMLAAGSIFEEPNLIVAHHEEVIGLVRESLGLGEEAVDETLQTFEILRLCAVVVAEDEFAAAVETYEQRSRALKAAEHLDQATQQAAWVERDRVKGTVAGFCHAYGSHLLASERTFDPETNRNRWGSPVAERLAEDVKRGGESHPLCIAWKLKPAELWLALKGVSVAVGRTGDRFQRNFSGFLPMAFWLDTGNPPANERM